MCIVCAQCVLSVLQQALTIEFRLFPFHKHYYKKIHFIHPNEVKMTMTLAEQLSDLLVREKKQSHPKRKQLTRTH